MDNQFILLSVGAGIIVSVAIFAAYKAGQVFGLREQIHAHTLDIEIIKLKIESALGRLLEETNVQLPEGLSLQDIIKNMVFPGDSIEEQILTYNQIYLELVVRGTASAHFLEFVNYLN